MGKDIITYRALDVKVLAVAVRRVEGAWSAYIGAVPGEKHEDEVQQVADWGSKLSYRIAVAIFGEMDLPYAS